MNDLSTFSLDGRREDTTMDVYFILTTFEDKPNGRIQDYKSLPGPLFPTREIISRSLTPIGSYCQHHHRKVHSSEVSTSILFASSALMSSKIRTIKSCTKRIPNCSVCPFGLNLKARSLMTTVVCLVSGSMCYQKKSLIRIMVFLNILQCKNFYSFCNVNNFSDTIFINQIQFCF